MSYYIVVNLMMRPGNKIIVLTEWLQPLQGGGNLVVYTQVSKGQCFGLPMDHPKIDSIYVNTGCLKCKHSPMWNHIYITKTKITTPI